MSLLIDVSEQKPRQIAVRVLTERLSGQEYTENILEKELSGQRLSAADRGLCQEVVYGIARWQETLDWLIARKTEGRTQKEVLRILLQLGLYQMFWLDRIPNHAAVHETVELAKRLGLGPQAGFVNAVLRGYTRERTETQTLLEELKISQAALGHSHPEWLYQRWQARWGAEKTAQLMDWNNTPPPTFARINSLRTDAAKLAERWKSEGVKFAARNWDWTGDGLIFQLDSHPPLAGLRSFREGLFYIQDPGTLLAVRELDPQPGESVLDLCAAPGGKTTFIAQLMQNRGRVTAQDIQADRLELIREWRIRPEEIERLRAAQLELLRQAAPRLKPGGTLVYSTCSLEPEENSGVVKQFLGEHSQFKLEKESELLPFADGVDGAYVAKMSIITDPSSITSP